MKPSAMMFLSILALAAALPLSGGALAQGGTQDKVLRPANCPEGQRLNSETRKCEGGPAGATTVKSSKPNSPEKTGNAGGGSSQPAEAVILNNNPDAEKQCIDAGGTWTGGVCATAEKQCIDAGGTWTGGVCATAEKQCIDAGGTWTGGVCIKE